MLSWAVNSLAEDCWEGQVSGVFLLWTNLAKKRLPGAAIKFEKDVKDLKQATEHLAWVTAVKIKREKGIKGPITVLIV